VALEVASLQQPPTSFVEKAPVGSNTNGQEKALFVHPPNDAWLGLAIESGSGEVLGYTIDAKVLNDGTLVSLTMIASQQDLYSECSAYKEITLAASDLDISREIIRTHMPVNVVEFLKQDVIGC